MYKTRMQDWLLRERPIVKPFHRRGVDGQIGCELRIVTMGCGTAGQAASKWRERRWNEWVVRGNKQMAHFFLPRYLGRSKSVFKEWQEGWSCSVGQDYLIGVPGKSTLPKIQTPEGSYKICQCRTEPWYLQQFKTRIIK